jgi:hypothetical protein
VTDEPMCRIRSSLGSEPPRHVVERRSSLGPAPIPKAPLTGLHCGKVSALWFRVVSALVLAAPWLLTFSLHFGPPIGLPLAGCHNQR